MGEGPQGCQLCASFQALKTNKAQGISLPWYYLGFPDSSVDKESACNAGDPGSITGSGRSPGEGIGYPLQFSWAPLVSQMVKNPSEIQETWVRKIPWRKAWQATAVFLPGESLWTEEPGGL